jgi:RNA polymerase sigma-70 factor (ECF subfamily)
LVQQELTEFERVTLPHIDAAYTLARYLVRDVQDAEDIVQEAYLRALRHFDGYRGGDARAWLLTIVRHCAFTWRRQRRRRGEFVTLDEAVDEPVLRSPSPEVVVLRRTAMQSLSAAIDSLPTEFREVVVLREAQQLSYKEIAQVIGAPIGTVMSRLARARKRLQQILGHGAREAG